MQPRLSALITLMVLTAATRSTAQSGQLPWTPSPWKDPGWTLGHTRMVNDIVYSRNGKFVVSAGEDGSLRVWNAGTGALLKTMASDAADVNALKLSPNDAFVASSGGHKGGKRIQVWSLAQGRLLCTFSTPGGDVDEIAWSPVGSMLANEDFDGHVVLRNPLTGRHRTLHVPVSAGDALAFSPDGKTLAVGDWGREERCTVALYDVQTGRRRKRWRTRAGVSAVTFSPSGRLVALVGLHKTTTIRDTFTGRIRKVVPSPADGDTAIVFSPEGTMFAVVSYHNGQDTAQFWALERTSPLSGRFELDVSEVKAISPDGRKFAGMDMREENRVLLCDTQNGKRRWASADPALILGSKPGLALLQGLSDAYKAYGLPTLPKPAYLAYVTDRKLPPQLQERYLAFVFPAAQPGDTTFYYIGWDPRRVGEDQIIQAVGPAQASLNGTENTEDIHTPFSNVVTAIQMQERGWTSLALEFLGRGLTGYRGDARRGLAEIAWKYWEETLVKPDTDRHISLSALRRLSETEFWKQDAAKHRLVADLEATLTPGQALSGSIEAEIDGLVDYHVQGTDVPFVLESNRPELSEADPSFKKLWLRGFEAVPTLLKHTADRRLTRTYFNGRDNAPPYIVRIGTVVADLLVGLADSRQELGLHWMEKEEWVGTHVDHAKAEQWWTLASAIGEESWLLQHVLPKKDSVNVSPNDHNAVLIAVKYPRQLAEIYREALDRYPHARNENLAKLLQQTKSETPGTAWREVP